MGSILTLVTSHDNILHFVKVAPFFRDRVRLVSSTYAKILAIA